MRETERNKFGAATAGWCPQFRFRGLERGPGVSDLQRL
jgi:hypothetical protein